jgi:hypothetical protein
MAGMGPAPKAADKRIRRNAARELTQLPARRVGKTPKWPLSRRATPVEAELWVDVWSKPVAVKWEREGCEREVAQYVIWKALAEHGDLPASKEARMLADRLLLNPMALFRAGLTVAVDEVTPKRTSAATPAAAGKATKARRLKAV